MGNRLSDVLEWTDGTKKYTERLLSKADGYENIIIFGAGIGGKQTYDLLGQYGMAEKIKAFSDNSDEKIGHDYCGLPVVQPSEICRSYVPALILVSSTAYDVIKEQLVRQGVAEENIFFFQPAGISLDENYDKEFISSHLDEFEKVYGLLADDESRSVYALLLNYRISKDNKWLDFMRPLLLPEKDQYFDKRLLDRYDFSSVFIDAGAYTGDTLESFMRNFPDWRGKYYCIEAGKESFQTLCTKLGDIDSLEIIPLNVAVWDKKGELYFDAESYGNGAGSRISNSGERVACISIDEILGGVTPGFIKMDIEGAEKNALIGAKNTIMNNRPVLAICIYHKPEDFFDIPLLIEETVPGEYEYYVRQYRYGQSETVLYAMPKSRKKHDKEL